MAKPRSKKSAPTSDPVHAVTQLKIGSRTYSVEHTPNATLLDDDRLGDVRFSTATVRVARDGATEFRAEILIHEILHALFSDSGYPISPENEEDVVRALSPRLCAFFRDNPGAIANLQAALAS